MTRSHSAYVAELNQRFWQYKEASFSESDVFEESAPRNDRPPVFVQTAAERNLLLDPQLSESQRRQVIESLPAAKRHQWFRSMRSSQSLAQSFFGNLLARGQIGLLQDVATDCGDHPFRGITSTDSVTLEHSIDYLGEVPGRSTEVDVLVDLDRKVAIECKFSEADVGTCSRTRDSKKSDYCCGDYTFQSGRKTRCSLSEIGIKYWDYISAMFHWDSESDLTPCPLSETYQLVRNVLAACVDSTGELAADRGFAVLVIDERNPAFQTGGKGRDAFDSVRRGLRNPKHLQLCTWQQLCAAIRVTNELDGLCNQIQAKYGM